MFAIYEVIVSRLGLCSFSTLQNFTILNPTKRLFPWKVVGYLDVILRPRSKFSSTMSMEADATVNSGSQCTTRERGRQRKAKKQSNKIRPIKVEKFRNDSRFDETSYYFKNGLRFVHPYSYTFQCHVKGRWFGKKVLDVCRKEFRSEAKDFYHKAIAVGLLTINGKRVKHDQILHSNELLHSRVHRHEPPVSGEPIKIIHCDDNVVVVDKPASIPVHPCGKYRHNTLVFILGKEYGFTGLHTIHRLDRLTSGLLIFARTTESSKKLDTYVRNRELEKTYLCKVKGQFPSEPIVCEEPINVVSHKIGVCRVSPQGKTCRTEFQRLSYDGETSIVQCIPHTGRMHQIRVHLQYLGYPIINDPLYNNPVWGNEIGKGDTSSHISDDALIQKLIVQHDEDLLDKLLEDNRQSCSESTKDKTKAIDNQLKRNEINEDNDKDEKFETSTKKFKYNESVERMDIGGSKEGIKRIKDTQGFNYDLSAKVTVENTSSSSGVKSTVEFHEFENLDHNNPTNEEIKQIKETEEIKKVKETEEIKKIKKTEEINPDLISAIETIQKLPSSSVDSPKGLVCDKINNDATTSEGIENVCDTDEGIKFTSVTDIPSNETENLPDDEININELLPADVVVKRNGETEEDRLHRLVMMFCQDCKIKYRDPRKSEMRIYLHALRYKGPDFDYSTEIPNWAQEHLNRCQQK